MYPEDMAIQSYIFDIWSKTAESFGFERYDASILEPANLYKAKGAENEELVNEQTYTFTDRGDREVTLRPEMTPTTARMVAAKQRELSFPIRWYSIPNFFRYERPQRGRLREFWQLNCDMFGSDHFTADIEIISLAHQILLNFGATPDMFEIRINDRSIMERAYRAIGLSDEQIKRLTRLNDKRRKISSDEYREQLNTITDDELMTEQIIVLLDQSDEQTDVILGLNELGITNVVSDKSLTRGFDYYTGTVFEIFDVSNENNRAMIGGGRFDDLTSMFGGDPVSGVGFGIGDVIMRDFLETHKLLPEHLKTNPVQVVIIPMTVEENLFAENIAMKIRRSGFSVATDIGTKKMGKKITSASERGSRFIIVIGDNETKTEQFTIKDLDSGEEKTGKISELIKFLETK